MTRVTALHISPGDLVSVGGLAERGAWLFSEPGKWNHAVGELCADDAGLVISVEHKKPRNVLITCAHGTGYVSDAFLRKL